MRRIQCVAGLLMLLCAQAGEAQAIASAAASNGTLAFDAHATLGAFTGTTSKLKGQLTGATTLSGVRGWVEAPAASLTTDNGKRDRDMASSMEFDKYPVIRFDLDSVTGGVTSGDSTAVSLAGRFTLHGQTHAVVIPGFVWLHARGARFRGAVPVDVKDYGVGGLSKALGMLKMNEHIVVRIDVAFGS